MIPKESTILVIEDDSAVSSLVKVCLEDEGFQAETAMNGLEAIDKAIEQKPDLVLLDLALPLLDGEKVAASLHQIYGMDLPIIVVSADSDAKKKAHRIGAILCLAKPFDIDDLIQSVRSVLSKVYNTTQAHNWEPRQRPI